MTRVLALLVPALLPALVLAGCGADEQEPSAPPDSPSAGTSAGSSAGSSVDSSAGLEAAIADVQAIAPALERFVRGTAYPRTLAEAEAAIAEAGLELAPGNRLATYRYDAEAVEFVLCVETGVGAWARYDTAPMSVRESGAAGGCPS